MAPVCYKRYLIDDEAPVPERTKRRRKRKEISEDMGDEEAVASSSTTQYLTQEDNQDDPVSTASDDTMNQPISGPSSSPGEPVEEHLEDPTSPTLDQKPTKEQVELLLLALKLKHGLTNRALEDIMHLINFSAGPGGELVSRSKYLFYKAFDSVKDILEVHYVCKSCNVSMQEGPFNVKCPVCDQDTSKAHAQRRPVFFVLATTKPNKKTA
ncbi:uncharacterized protein LOC132856415 [Tachysurus vachellii]|uniref:uncharacterized protein LOC132856415 n=1 Tax=Tachysurus vachellii TaxID=175792 RepID=UPI00296B52FE|nr:uncharacterized protein LOC132856415 [Tachysurus vachellii]